VHARAWRQPTGEYSGAARYRPPVGRSGRVAAANENWEFDDHGLMRRREASINDVVIDERDRRIFGTRPEAERGAQLPIR
jgi:nuclear transport factor 2 (NTF2) superfamily protein